MKEIIEKMVAIQEEHTKVIKEHNNGLEVINKVLLVHQDLILSLSKKLYQLEMKSKH